MPEHAFWDIKTPLLKTKSAPYNKAYPLRANPFDNFYEQRDYDDFMREKDRMRNINNYRSRFEKL